MEGWLLKAAEVLWQEVRVQVSGFHSGVPVLPLDNCGVPGKLLDPFAVSVSHL